jgi:hypothetical protein
MFVKRWYGAHCTLDSLTAGRIWNQGPQIPKETRAFIAALKFTQVINSTHSVSAYKVTCVLACNSPGAVPPRAPNAFIWCKGTLVLVTSVFDMQRR